MERSTFLRYSIAILAVFLATAIRLALNAFHVQETPFLTFTLAVMVAAYFGGIGPGLTASALSLLTVEYAFLQPRYSFAIAHRADIIALAIFTISGVAITLLTSRLQRAFAIAAESQATTAAVLDSSVQAIIAAGNDGSIVMVNSRTGNMFGYTAGELVGQPHEMLMPERLRGRHRQHYASFVSAPRPRLMGEGMDLIGRRKDGSEFPVLVTLNSIRTARGALSVSFVTDITERKRMEESSRRQYELMNTITESAGEGLILVDSGGRVTYANPAAEHLLGWTADELRGAMLQDRVHCPLESVLTTGKGVRALETVLFRKDGAPLSVSSSVMPIVQDGKVTGAVTVVSDITERKQSEEALRQSEQQYRALFESIPQAFVVAQVLCDPAGKPIDWRFLDANPAFESIFGRKSAELVGRTYREMFPDAPAWEYWVSSLGEVALSRRPAHLEEYDSKGRRIEAIAYSPAAGQFAGVFTDVTEKEQAETALRHSEERFRTLFESMDEGFASCQMIYDEAGRAVDFRYIMVNPAFGKMTGLAPTDVTGRTVRELLRTIEPFWIETYERVVRTGKSEHVAHPMEALGRWLEVFVWCLGPAQFAMTFTDITERRRAEQALRRMSELVDLSHDAIVTTNLDRVIHTWNAGAAELYGWTEAEAVGRVLHDFLHTRSPMTTAQQDEDLQKYGRWAGELAHVSKNGTALFVDSCQVLDSSGDDVSILEINRDITDRKHAEEGLRRLNADLEQRVRERTAQLEAANKELESFAYSVSHDLRAPLRGIDGWSLALLEDYADRLDEDGRKHLAWVRSEAQRMGTMIEDLLQLSRVTRGRMDQGRVDLTALAEAVTGRLRKSAPDRSLAFEIRPGLSARGDARLLEIALTNLLENAFKYTGPRAEAHIEVGQAPNGEAPTFYVRDNGVGFNPAYGHKLFTAFQRLHKPSEFPGTGIGLATVQRIIHRHGGRVWAQSVQKEGATFYFTLPETGPPSAETK